MPDFVLEDEAGGIVAGVDEAGRGPWAGPVVAAAVILHRDRMPDGLAAVIDDSKALKRARREEIRSVLTVCADIGIGAASAVEIDTHNVLQATFLAMQRAVASLSLAPHTALIDGNRAPALPCPAVTVVKGDARSLSIAAASIVAKVTRDRIMESLGRRYPAFGWERNAGYGTREHQRGLEAAGVTPHHRKTYAPIERLLNGRV